MADRPILFSAPMVREAHSLYGSHGQHRADGMRWGPWGGLPKEEKA